VVAIANGATQFIAACEAALAQAPEQNARMVEAMQAIVAATSWDNTARRMSELMDAAPPYVDRRAAPRAAFADADAEAAAKGRRATNVNPLRAHAPHVGTVVIGAGPTGLAAALHLGADTLVLDRKESLDGTAGAATAIDHVKGKIECNADVVQVLPREHIVALRDGRRFRYDDLVATIPLPELVKTIDEDALDARDGVACKTWLKASDILVASTRVTGKEIAEAVRANRGRAQKVGAE
jgi:hypothetical protein